MTAKLCVAIVAAALVWGLKHHYSIANADDLWWVLTPTAALVQSITGAVFTATPGEGYFSRERLFLIEKSCAGINFMVAAFGMLVFTSFHRLGTGMSAVAVLVLSLMGSYAAAVAVNAVRISIAMWLAAHPVELFALSAADLHRIEGIAVYFSGLVLLYELARRSDVAARRHPCTILAGRTVIARACRRAAVPLTAYYAVTLGIPLVNGAARSEARLVDHAVTVVVVPLLMVALASAFSGNPLWRKGGDGPGRRRCSGRWCRRGFSRRLGAGPLRRRGRMAALRKANFRLLWG